MKLLDAKKVKDEKRRKDEELKENIRKMNEEEGAAVERLNAALAAEATEKKRIAEDFSLARAEGAAAVKKSVLLQEIRTLEEKKAEALKPIHEIQREAENLLENARQTRADLEKREADVKESEQNLSERFETLIDREAENLKKNSELNKRESTIKAAEEEVRISTEILSKKWGTFHEEVHNTNQEFRHKEKEIEVAKQANEAYRESLAQKELELGRLEYKIKDGFAELEKARKHVVGEL